MPSSSGASFAERKIEVGPSAPPMIPMAAASPISKRPVARGAPECDEYAELRRGSEEQGPGVGDDGAEVGHCTDAQEDDRREDVPE